MCKIGIYLVCDYPNKDEFLKTVDICEKNSIDFLEIGFPFSDPVADGAVIEKAALDVLKKENTNDFMKSLKEVRKRFSKKLYVMTYANVIFGYSTKKFAEDAEFIDGIIIADLPFAENQRFKKIFDKYGINIIHFVTPESSFSDIDKIKAASEDFIYFVSTRGITGGKFTIDDETREKIEYAENDFENDVIVGFGIRDKYDIQEICGLSDGAIIGTEAVRKINSGMFEEYILDLT